MKVSTPSLWRSASARRTPHDAESKNLRHRNKVGSPLFDSIPGRCQCMEVGRILSTQRERIVQVRPVRGRSSFFTRRPGEVYNGSMI